MFKNAINHNFRIIAAEINENINYRLTVSKRSNVFLKQNVTTVDDVK